MGLPVLKQALVTGVDSGGNPSALTITTASDTPADAFLVAIMFAGYDGALATAPTTGTWTDRGSITAGTNTRHRVWTRFAGTAAAQTVVVNGGASSTYGTSLVVLVWTNVDLANPWHTSSSTASASNTYAIPAITTAVADCMEVAAYGGVKFGTGTVTNNVAVPSGMTEDIDYGPDSACYLVTGVSHLGQASALTTPTRSVGVSDTGWTAVHFAVKGAVAVTGQSAVLAGGGDLTAEVIRHKPNAEATRSDLLTNFASALANRATTPVDILFLGDSITEGQGASTRPQRWVELLRDRLRAAYPVSGVAGGEGYVPAFQNVTLPAQAWATSGTVATTFDRGLGNHGRSLGASGVMGHTCYGTSVKIAYTKINTAGVFQLRVDGSVVASANTAFGATGTKDDTGTLSYTFTTRGSHLVEVVQASGTVYITGAWVYDQDETSGVRITEIGWSGAKASDWQTWVGQEVAQFQALAPQLVVIMLGTNDYAASVTAATYGTQMASIVSQLRTALPNVDILLMGPPLRNTYDYSGYLTQLQTIARTTPRATMLDLGRWTLDGSVAGASIQTDSVHFSDEGHRLAGWAVFTSLQPGSVGMVATLAGAGTLAASAGQAIAATFAGAGSMSASASATRAAAATFAGSGALTASPAATPAAATFGGTGAMSVAATQTGAAAATFAGSGSMSALLGIGIQATFAGSGSVAVGVAATYGGAAAFVGVGAMSTAATRNQPLAATFTGSGAMATTATRNQPVAAAFAGSGAVTIGSVAQNAAVAASFVGEGAMFSLLGQGVQATFAGAGAMTVADTATYALGSALIGAGQMLTAVLTTQRVAVSLSGTGLMTTVTGRGQPVAATFAGAGSLSAGVLVNYAVTASFVGAGSLTTAADRVHPVAATFAGSGALAVASVKQTMAVAATFAGSGTLVVLASSRQFIKWTAVGAGSMSTTAFRTQPVAATFAGSGSMTLPGVTKTRPLTASFAGSGTFTAAGVRKTFTSASFVGAGNLTARITAVPGRPLVPSVWAIHPTTGAYIPLPHFTKLSVSPKINGVGACSIEYPYYGANFAVLHWVLDLQRDIEVAVWLGGSKTGELRFLLDEVAGDDIAEDAVWTFAGASLETVLDEGLIYNQPVTAPNNSADMRFSAANAGQIVLAVLAAAQTRGAIAGYQIDWNTTVDSLGNAWTTQVNINFSPGTSLLAVLDKLVELDMLEYEVTAAHKIRLYAPNRYGTDRTTSSNLHPVTFRNGRNLTDAPRKFSLKGSGTALLAAGSEGLYNSSSDATAQSRRGRRIEVAASAGNLSDVSALAAYASAELTDVTAGTLEVTHGLTFTPGDPRPLLDFDKGDWVWSDTTGKVERLRVAQWSLTVDAGGASGTVSLNDLFTDRLVQLRRKLNQVSSGALVVGTSTPSADTGVPTAPTSLIVSSQAYLAGSVVRSSVSLGWTAPTLNVDGTQITDLQGYKVQFTYHSSPTSWKDVATPSNSSTSCTFEANPGVQIDIRVAAFDVNGNQSAWSSVFSHTTAADATAPPTPSTPIVDNYLGTLRITWDQNTSTGSDMFSSSADFDYVEVHLSTSASFTASQTTMVGQLYAKGTWVVTDLPYGTAQYARFKAVDSTGNKSAQSATGTATPGQVVSADLFDGCVGTLKLADLAVKTAKIDNLAVNDAQMGSVAIGKLTAGTMSAAMLLSGIIRTATSGNRTEIDSAGIRLYDTGGTLRVNLKTVDGSALVTGQYQSALSGMRVVINPGQTNPARIDFYSSGSQFASIEAVNVGGSGAIVLSGNNFTGADGGVIMAYPSFARMLFGSKSAANITSEVYTDGITARVNSPIVDIAIDSQHSAAGGNRVAFSVFDASRVNRTATQLNYWATGAFNGEPWLAAVNRDVGLVFTDGPVNSIPGGWGSAIYAVDNTSTAHRDFRCAGLIYDNGTYSSSSRKIKRNIQSVADEGLDVRDAFRHGRAHFFEKIHHDEPAVVNPEGELLRPARKARRMLGLLAEDMPTDVQVTIADSLPQRTDVAGINMEAVTALTWHGLGDLWDEVEQLRAQVATLSTSLEKLRHK